METNPEFGHTVFMPANGELFDVARGGAIGEIALLNAEMQVEQPEVEALIILEYPEYTLTDEELTKFTMPTSRLARMRSTRQQKKQEKLFTESVDRELDKYFVVPERIVYHLCQTGRAELTIPYLRRNNNVDTSLVAKQLLLDGKKEAFVEASYGFYNLDSSVAMMLINQDDRELLNASLPCFKHLSETILYDLIDHRYVTNVVRSAANFDVTDTGRFVDAIIESGHAQKITRFIDNLTNLNHDEIIDRLLAADYGWAVASSLESFNCTDKFAVVERMIAGGNGADVAEWFDNYTNCDSATVFQLLLESNQMEAAVRFVHNFTEISSVSIDFLIDKQESKGVFEALARCPGYPLDVLVDRFIAND